MNKGTIIPWFVDWSVVYEIDNGGPVSTLVAERILAKHLEVGAIGVRVRTVPVEWLRPIFRAMDVPIIVGMVWNSIFRKDPEHAQVRWLAVQEGLVETWRPDIIYVDREGDGLSENPDTITKVREFTDKLVGPQVPIYVWCAAELFPGHYGGTAPCPHYYRVWNADKLPKTKGMTPVERLHWLRDNYHSPTYFDVRNGYTWMMPFTTYTGGFRVENMPPIDDWATVIKELWYLDVAGISLYPSPCGFVFETGPLVSKMNAALFRYMRIAHDILKVKKIE